MLWSWWSDGYKRRDVTTLILVAAIVMPLGIWPHEDISAMLDAHDERQMRGTFAFSIDFELPVLHHGTACRPLTSAHFVRLLTAGLRLWSNSLLTTIQANLPCWLRTTIRGHRIWLAFGNKTICVGLWCAVESRNQCLRIRRRGKWNVKLHRR
jgi:hypothetical protein